MDEITFDEWKKLKMKVGKVVEVERVPKTDKLYKLQVDVGEEKPRQVVTSLVPFYTEEEIMGQRIVVLVNLATTKFVGEVSEAMLLCAEKDDESECILLTTEKDIDIGTPIT